MGEWTLRAEAKKNANIEQFSFNLVKTKWQPFQRLSSSLIITNFKLLLYLSEYCNLASFESSWNDV